MKSLSKSLESVSVILCCTGLFGYPQEVFNNLRGLKPVLITITELAEWRPVIYETSSLKSGI